MLNNINKHINKIINIIINLSISSDVDVFCGTFESGNVWLLGNVFVADGLVIV